MAIEKVIVPFQCRTANINLVVDVGAHPVVITERICGWRGALRFSVFKCAVVEIRKIIDGPLGRGVVGGRCIQGGKAIVIANRKGAAIVVFFGVVQRQQEFAGIGKAEQCARSYAPFIGVIELVLCTLVVAIVVK